MDAQEAMVEGLHELGIVGDSPLKRFNVECMGAWHREIAPMLEGNRWNVDDIQTWYIEAWTAAKPGHYRVLIEQDPLTGLAVKVWLEPVCKALFCVGEVSKSGNSRCRT